jgi:hypothetical protein
VKPLDHAIHFLYRALEVRKISVRPSSARVMNGYWSRRFTSGYLLLAAAAATYTKLADEVATRASLP